MKKIPKEIEPMKARTITSRFVVGKDSDNAGVKFYVGNRAIDWKDLTYEEQIKTLNAWARMYQLFYYFVKEEGEE